MPSIKTVTVWTLDQEGEDQNSGTISWDGDELTCEPDDDKRLRNIMEEPIQGRDENRFDPQSDPEGWLNALQWHYKSPYLRVGPPKESVDEGTGAKSLEVIRAARQLVHGGGAPGMGQIFMKAGKVWYVGSKGDQEDFQWQVEQLLSSVQGVSKVDYHQEEFPPRDKGWVMVYPKRHEWVGNIGYNEFLWQDFNPASTWNEGAGNCGIAKGGFQPGNTCARGEGGGINSDEVDAAANRPSRPEERHEGAAPMVKEYREPPPKKGKKGGGQIVRPKGDKSQTKLGDESEVLTEQLGFRNILPEGKRHFTAKEVAEMGSSIDREYDHSGRLYEVKMCNVEATEYRLKAKAEEKEAKVKYADKHGAEVYTMIGVRDGEAGEVHFYGSKKAGLIGAEVSEKNFDYLGTVKIGGKKS